MDQGGGDEGSGGVGSVKAQVLQVSALLDDAVQEL